MKTIPVLLLVTALTACSTPSQAPSPYVGLEARDIKALSPSEIADLLAGKGMGFAKSAELNEYPGPAHVLELKAKLQLTPEQVAQTKIVFARMETAAKKHGAELVQAERELEALFRTRQVTAESLTQAVEQVASRQAKVRNAHLAAHVEQTRLLYAAQIAHYVALRGYDSQAGHHGGHK